MFQACTEMGAGLLLHNYSFALLDQLYSIHMIVPFPDLVAACKVAG